MSPNSQGNNAAITRGIVVGFVQGHRDFVIITDGIAEVWAQTPEGVQPTIGDTYTVYKQGSTYFMGNRVNAQ
jgi:hypothetical protein